MDAPNHLSPDPETKVAANIHLPEDVHDTARRIARRRKISMSELIEESLRMLFEEYERSRPPGGDDDA